MAALPPALPGLLLAVVLAGCSTPSPSQDMERRFPPAPNAGSVVQTADGLQTIVKLKDTRLRLDDAATRERLARAAGVPLTLVREISGDNWLVALQVAPGAAYQAALQRLQASGLVAYAEPDEVMTTMPVPGAGRGPAR